VAGMWTAVTTGTQKSGFSFAAAPQNHAAGARTTGQVGEIFANYPYVYIYTYATLRNDAGVFGPGKGPGSFNLIYKNFRDTQAVASINLKQGAARFGGTMKMLGALTSKVCYYRNGTCSLGHFNWRYDAVGAPAYTSGSVVTRGYLATYKGYYYNTALMHSSTIDVDGYRFPWTTGTVTVSAPRHAKWRSYNGGSIHYAHGYDNRNTTTLSGKGTIQLVTPVLTHWGHDGVNYETAGIGILRIKFVPEPQTWVMLVVGASLLCVAARMRGR
jgi:hypothetical protein